MTSLQLVCRLTARDHHIATTAKVESKSNLGSLTTLTLLLSMQILYMLLLLHPTINTQQ